jgi:PDZ domain/Aspartyl protease
VALRGRGRSVWLVALGGACWLGPPVAPPTPLTVLPFDPYGGAIYVPSVINGDSAWLMFDTGLPHTGLDREWAQAIGAIPAPGAGARAAPPVTTVLDTLRLGDIALHTYPVALYPLRPVSEASGRLQRGLVGDDVMQRFTVEIDFQQRQVRLYDPERYHYAGPGTVVPFTADADLPLLSGSVKIRGQRAIPARLLLDTGASGLCLILTTPFVAQHGLSKVSPAIEAPIGTGLAGELHGLIARLQELRVGSLRVQFPTTGLGGEHKGFLGRTDIDGVIANAVFEGSRVIVDYARRRVIVESHAGPGTPCDYDMSGLRLAARGPRLRQVFVDYVVPHSPGADAGIAVGDELLRIDGRPLADAVLNDVREELRIAGAVRRLLLRRDADTIAVAVRLRRLL